LSVKFIGGDRRKREPFFELTDNRETNFGTLILSSSGAFLCGTSVYARGYARLGSSLSMQAIYLVVRAASIFDSVHLGKALLNKLISSIGREPFEFRIGKGLIHRIVTRFVNARECFVLSVESFTRLSSGISSFFRRTQQLNLFRFPQQIVELAVVMPLPSLTGVSRTFYGSSGYRSICGSIF
jgi:hypothetical protein